MTIIHVPNAIRIFRHRNFQLFFVGQLVSLIGTWMQSTAQQWLVYRITDSQTSLGMVTFISFLPVLLLSLPMGVLVDRFPKKNLLLFTQVWFMAVSAVLAVLTFTGIVRYWHILLLAFISGLANSLDMPTRQAFYVEMADREELTTAIGINAAMFNAGRIVGPAVAGIVVAAVGEAPAFAINSASFLAVIASLILMKLTPRENPAQRQKGMKDLFQGFTYIRQEKRIFGLVVMVALFSFFGAPYLILLTVFARDILQTGPQGFGQLMASQGVGALLGAFGVILFSDRRKKGHILIFSRFLLGISVAALALSRAPLVSMIAMVFAGYAFVSQNITTNTLIQTIVPDALRGRVMSAFTWALGGFFPLGSLMIGAIGDRLGAPTAAMIVAVCTILLACLNLILFPEMKNLE